jgi:two-component system response regulator AtoC
VVCSTNKDLEAAVETRAFREDLFYRIDEMGLHLLPLRERKEDIPQLCAYLMGKVAGQIGKSAPRLTPSSLQVLKQWNWPGNLRELENWIARVIILGGQEAIVEEFRRQVMLANAVDNREASIGHLREASHQAVSAATRAAILKVLNANQGNRRRTADELNMSYRSLLSKLREMGVYQRRRSHLGLQYRTDSPPPRRPKGPDIV